MRRFGTQGRVYPDKHYVVPRTEEITDFNSRVREGRYIVLFAPRQTGKTTFFRMAMDTLTKFSATKPNPLGLGCSSGLLFDIPKLYYFLLSALTISNLCSMINSMNISNKDHKYNTTATTTYACEYHIIWATKYRRSVLSPEIQERLKALIFEQQEAYQYIVREVESMPDHVHLLASIPPNVSVTSVIGKIKGYTAKILRNEFPTLKSRLPCLWTRSKFVASAGNVTLEVLKQYIENQKGV